MQTTPSFHSSFGTIPQSRAKMWCKSSDTHCQIVSLVRGRSFICKIPRQRVCARISHNVTILVEHGRHLAARRLFATTLFFIMISCIKIFNTTARCNSILRSKVESVVHLKSKRARTRPDFLAFWVPKRETIGTIVSVTSNLAIQLCPSCQSWRGIICR